MADVAGEPRGTADSSALLPGAPLLAIENLSLEYRTAGRILRATHRVSFEVWGGDRFILLGPSGCGKSTILKAVAGFIAPSEGRVTLDGRPVTGPGPDRIVVFQDSDQLPPWKTVHQNVVFPLRASGLLGRKEANERASQYIEKVGLSAFAQAYPHTLSGGMKQRVAIARALAMQPRVLLMDEPFAALDALTRRRMQDELLALWADVGFTLLFVTHAIDEALIVGSRIGLLSAHPGRMRAEVNAGDWTTDSTGAPAFQAAAARIHRLLFDDAGARPAPLRDDAP